MEKHKLLSEFEMRYHVMAFTIFLKNPNVALLAA